MVMKLNRFFEFKESDFDPIKSLRIKDDLNSKIWTDFEIDQEVRKSLLTISQDFFTDIEIDAEILDVVLCGSLCNYTWNEKYSDYDMHIIVKFSDIDDNIVLVEKLMDFAKKKWNYENDIFIGNYEVEIAVQDTSDLKEAIKSGRMGGVFSLLKNKWIKKPEKIDFVPDEEMIRDKGSIIMSIVDQLESDIDDVNYEKFTDKLKSVWKKIKALRLSGLEEGGEFGFGNLMFKFLRRNGYIQKIMDLRKKSYADQFK